MSAGQWRGRESERKQAGAGGVVNAAWVRGQGRWSAGSGLAARAGGCRKCSRRSEGAGVLGCKNCSVCFGVKVDAYIRNRLTDRILRSQVHAKAPVC